MGQARQKNQYISQCFSLMRTLGDPQKKQDQRTAALDELLLLFGQKLFDLETASTANQAVYRQALAHDDAHVRDGLQAFMDIFLGYAWRGTHPAEQSLTIALFCGLDLPALDMIGSMADTRVVRQWLGKTLGISQDKIDVYPATVDPTLCYQDITSLVLDFYGAKEAHQPGQSRKDSVRYDEKKPDAQDYVVLLATLRLDGADDLDRMVEKVEHGLEVDHDDHFDIYYTVNGQSSHATVEPFHVGLPYSVMRKYAFYYAQQKLKNLISGLVEQGVPLTDLGVDINLGTLAGENADAGTAVYAEAFNRRDNAALGQRYLCQTDYAAYGMGAALDTVIEAGVTIVRMNGLVAYDANTQDTAV